MGLETLLESVFGLDRSQWTAGSTLQTDHFTVCGPAAWTSLPAAVQDLKTSSSLSCLFLQPSQHWTTKLWYLALR